MLELEQYTIDLLEAIRKLDQHTTESNILIQLDLKYGYKATMYFNDAIRKLETDGKVIRMQAGGIRFWEIV